MRYGNRRLGVLAAVAVAAIPLAVVATAFACGSLATLKLDRAAARAGAEIRVVGANFNSNPEASPVTIRFNSRNGRVLWEGRPSEDGKLVGEFTVPRARRGYYVIVATQTGPNGRPAAGTPGRAPLKVRRKRRARRSSDAIAAIPWAPSPGSGGPSAAPVGLPALLGSEVLALGLLGGGIALARSGRRRHLDAARSVS